MTWLLTFALLLNGTSIYTSKIQLEWTTIPGVGRVLAEVTWSNKPRRFECWMDAAGVKHCWELLGSWDPIPDDYRPKWMSEIAMDGRRIPEPWGYYATEQRTKE